MKVPIFKGKAFLVNEGSFVTGIAVAAEAEISQTVDDAPPFIGLRSLHNVGMGTQNQMSAVVDGKMGKIALGLVGIGLKLRSPVEIADDETGALSLHLFQFRNELCLRAARKVVDTNKANGNALDEHDGAFFVAKGHDASLS